MANGFHLIKRGFVAFSLRIEAWQHHLNVSSIDGIVRNGGYEALLRLIERLNGSNLVETLRSGGAVVGDGCRLSRGLTLHNAPGSLSNLEIGHNVHIGRQVFIDLADKVTIGARVTISMRTTILTHTHFGDVQNADGTTIEPTYGPVRIEDDVYVGAGAILLAGITLAKGSRVGAGAVVNRSVAAGETVGGVPAKTLRGRSA